ncbi:MAG TPA: mycofactocin biosynthesis peptidyl-dipeptidase MftE [Motilibacteraceae bacterium]|nr:mycofactocin biosynthesis peptidyl-dipeptidase MftE [Motilibacteraceae bacterium]
MRLAAATWPEVDRHVRELLVVPLGSLEQHGPHLPLRTDTLVAEAVSQRVHENRPGSGLAPAIAIGASGEHADFPGTLSIGTDALCHLLVELVRHATLHWPGVLVLNGHGGNLAAVRQAAERCAAEGRALEVVTLGLPGMDAHAGRAETSMLLHLAPSEVRLDLAEAGRTEPIAELLPVMVEHGVRAVSPNGVLGDPAGASEEEGAELVDGLVRLALAGYDRAVAATRQG